MKPLHLAAVVAVLGVAALVAVALLTDPSAPAAPAGSAVAAPADPGRAPTLAGVPVVAASAVAKDAAAPLPEWDRVEVNLRPSELGPELAAPVSNGLDALRDSMSPCFEAERTHPRPPAAQAESATGPAILVFRLESTSPGRLAVSGSEVETTGHSSRELVECCREAAKGYEMAVPVIDGRRRFRVKMLLQ
jgi:hypothetical protein